MTVLGQKQAVFQAVTTVLGQDEFDSAVSLTKDQKAQVRQMLFEGFRAGEISIDREYDDKGLNNYIGGLISNWLKRDTRFNGGVAYVAKNKGSRTDPQIKEMTKLLNSAELSDEQKELVKATIEARRSEIKPAKTVTVDFDKIPADLREMLGL
jgi:hypothetical protein